MAVESDSPAFAAGLRRAMEMARSGELVPASDELQRLLATDPDHADALQLLGLVRRRQGAIQEAIRLFETSLARNPAQPHVENNLGNALIDQGDRETGCAAYRRAIALAPSYGDAWLNLAAALLPDHCDEALHAAERAVALMPASPKARTTLGLCLKARGALSEARSAFEAALRIRPDHVPALHALGLIAKAEERPADALAFYERCFALGADLPEIHYNHGNALYDLGRRDEAAVAWESAVRLRPSFREAHDTLNKYYWQHGLTERYLASYAEAVKKTPQEAGLYIDWAEKLMLSSRPAEALEVMRRAFEAGLKEAGLSHALGRALMGLGQYDKAEQALLHAIGRDPGCFPARLDLARALLLAGEWTKAEAVAAEACRLRPLDQEALAWRGLAWRMLGDPRENVLNDYERFVRSYKLPAPPGYETIEAFNLRLAEVLHGLHKASEHPVEQTLRGGSQTMGSLFAKAIPEIAALRGLIEDAIRLYQKDLPDDPAHPFLGRKSDRFHFSGSWSVRLRRQGFHVNHVHGEGWISSCYYVSLPPVVASGEGQQGWIKFGESSLMLGGPDRIMKTIRPESGLLALFPSYVYHGTIPFEDDTPRLTVAFDVVPD
ncbi:MAG: putative 2OG-Fe(II) oxygenase [Rhodothalassiaceae bacterium]